MSKSNNAKNIVIGTLVGLAAGYVAGVLTAPKSGKETRDDLINKGTDVWSDAQNRLRDLQDDLTDVIDAAKSRIGDVSSRRKKELDDLIDNAQDAKDKVQDVLRAVRTGEADDRDLQNAVTSATKAKRHLGDFLRKS